MRLAIGVAGNVFRFGQEMYQGTENWGNVKPKVTANEFGNSLRSCPIRL
jgi:hypothetical protein